MAVGCVHRPKGEFHLHRRCGALPYLCSFLHARGAYAVCHKKLLLVGFARVHVLNGHVRVQSGRDYDRCDHGCVHYGHGYDYAQNGRANGHDCDHYDRGYADQTPRLVQPSKKRRK